MPTTNPAAKLRQLAESLTSTIEAKRNPGCARQRVTPRRARMADEAAREADRIERVQRRLTALADGHDAKTLDPVLARIKNRAQVEDLMLNHFPIDPEHAVRKRMAALGLNDPEAYAVARTALVELATDRVESPIQVQIAAAERELIGCRIPGYFPTPPAVVAQLLEAAALTPGMTVLEPSAGKGDIAVAARAAGASVTCVEVQQSLARILMLKSFEVMGVDFMHLPVGLTYDRVLMNPPFERGQDGDHVRHAYKMVKPGGRLVAIMSEGTFGRGDAKATGFREWLERVGGVSTKIPAGAFYASDRPTGVPTRLVVIEKGAADVR